MKMIQFATANDGTPLHGIFKTPAGSAQHPGILIIHGGGFTEGGPGIINVFKDDLINAGFTTFSSEYRLDPPHHLQGQKSKGTYPDQTNDVDLAVAYLRRHPSCNGSVQIVGGSAGGYHAAWQSARGIIPSVCFSPVTHLDTEGTTHFEVLCKNYAQGFEDEASPITHITQLSKPSFTRSYEIDNLPANQFTEWKDKLTAAKIENDSKLLKGPGHSFEMWPLVRDEAIAWLQKHK